MPIDIGDLSFFNGLKMPDKEWEDWEWREIEFWKPLCRGVNIIDGAIRSGKSTYLALSAFKFKKYFNQEVICDSPGLFKPSFGKCEYLNWGAILDSLAFLAKTKKISKYQVISHYLLDLYLSVGIDPRGKTINIDEAHKVVNKRRGMSDSIQIVGQTARQIAHLGSCLQISSQEAIKGLDQNEVISFATAKIVCSYDQVEKVSYYALQSKFLPLDADGRVVTYPFLINPDNWKEIYNSFSPVQNTSVKELVINGGRP